MEQFTTNETKVNTLNGSWRGAIGLPGNLFDVIHVTALVVLPISIICSTGVLIYILPPIRTFFARLLFERLIVYLAVCDFLFSFSHIFDHAYMLVKREHPPDQICVVQGFFLNEFILAQKLTVIFAAVNALVSVVFNKKIPTGKYDWRLLLYAFGTPTLTGTLLAATDNLGPSGMWCYIDLRNPAGRVLSIALAVVMLLTISFLTISYMWIWVKIGQAPKLPASSRKYHGTARVMMMFVAAYILNSWAYVVFATWQLFEEPHAVVLVATVLFSNLGGVFNFLAYTYIRKKLQHVKPGTSDSGTTTTTNNTQHVGNS